MYFTLRASRFTRSALYIASAIASARHFDLLQLYMKMATGSNFVVWLAPGRPPSTLTGRLRDRLASQANA